jgi:hypothetical protein
VREEYRSENFGYLTIIPLTSFSKRTLKAALLSWQEEGTKIAAHHLEFATKVNSDIVKPLENFLKTKEPERKKVLFSSLFQSY